MRYIDLSLIDENDSYIAQWIQAAKEKTLRLYSLSTPQERKEYIKNNNLWSDFKDILLDIYGDKCWYSECDLTGSFGDVDHFRPKGKSTDENKREILKEGYWWLAYDYHNYRLSCEKCNRKYGGGGKSDRFPLRPGTLPATAPNSDDIPVLLDPCVLHDVQLIDCDEAGEIIPISRDEYEIERVRISSQIYNWKVFNTRRKEIRNNCKTALEQFEIAYEKETGQMRRAIESLKRLTDDKAPYSSFARKYIKMKTEGKPFATVIEKCWQA